MDIYINIYVYIDLYMLDIHRSTRLIYVDIYIYIYIYIYMYR